jgi:hypothetical protein
MRTRFEQVHTGRWPSGADKTIAIIKYEPEDLTERSGVRFTAGSDESDEFVEAGLRLPSGRPILLMRYAHDSFRGTAVHADSRDDAEVARGELLEALRLASDAYSWIPEGG